MCKTKEIYENYQISLKVFVSCVIVFVLSYCLIVLCHYFCLVSLLCLGWHCHLSFYQTLYKGTLFLDHHVTQSIDRKFHTVSLVWLNQPFANRVARNPVFLTEPLETNFMIIVFLLDCRLKLDGILVPQIFTFLYFLIGPDTCR